MPQRDSSLRGATAALLCTRIAYGLGLIAAPVKLAGGRWLGEGAAAGPSQVPLRGVGGREIAVHGLALAALLRGSPVRPWLLASVLGDLTDVVATTLSRRELPEGSAPATALVAGGSAALTLAAAALLDE